jgi:hypothetical protein
MATTLRTSAVVSQTDRDELADLILDALDAVRAEEGDFWTGAAVRKDSTPAQRAMWVKFYGLIGVDA